MKKQYLTPYIKGHKIVVTQILAGSESLLGNTYGNGLKNQSKRAGSFFDDEEPAQSTTKEHDFAYGL